MMGMTPMCVWLEPDLAGFINTNPARAGTRPGHDILCSVNAILGPKSKNPMSYKVSKYK